MVLTWVSSGSCNLHAQTKQAAFQLENGFQGAYHRVKGKHAENTGLPARNGGPWRLRAPFFPGKERSVWFLSECTVLSPAERLDWGLALGIQRLAA